MVAVKPLANEGTKAVSRPVSVQSRTSYPYALRPSRSRYDLVNAAAVNIKTLWTTTLRPVLSMALFFNVMGILCLTFLAVAVSMKAQRHKAFYDFYPTPNVVKFEEIAVLTTTPQCNDLARVLAVENYTVFAIAAALQICLSFVEPQKSGLGGSSTVVLVDLDKNEPCHILDTFEDFHEPAYKNSAGEKREGDNCLSEKLDGMPYESVALPGDVHTRHILLDEVGKTERERLKNFMESYKISKNAISSFVAASNRQFSPWLVFSNQMAWMFDQNDENPRGGSYGERQAHAFRPKDEGEAYDYGVNLINKMIPEAEEYNGESELEDMLSLGCEKATLKLAMYEKTVRNYQNASRKDWTRSNGTIFGNYTLCMPAPFDESLSEAEPKDSNYEGEGDTTKEILTINDFISDVFKHIREQEEAKQKAASKVRKKREAKGTFKLPKDTKSLRGMWQANMFVVISQVERKAIVYVGTLGQFFGSKIKTKDDYFLNSIIHEKEGPGKLFTRLIPAILFKKDEISLALATPGGSTRHSLSLPRTIEMLLMKEHFNKTIVESAGYPLAYPSAEDEYTVIKSRVPYVERLHRYYNVSKINPDYLPDEIVAVEKSGDNLIALHTDHLNDFSYMPAGI